MSEFVILSGARSAESKNLGSAVRQMMTVLFSCGAKILRQAQDDKSLLHSNHLSTPNSSLLTPNLFSLKLHKIAHFAHHMSGDVF